MNSGRDTAHHVAKPRRIDAMTWHGTYFHASVLGFGHVHAWVLIHRNYLYVIGGTEFLWELYGLKGILSNAFDPGQYRMLVVGIAMVAVMNWKPRGLIAIRKPSIFLVEEKCAASRVHLSECDI